MAGQSKTVKSRIIINEACMKVENESFKNFHQNVVICKIFAIACFNKFILFLISSLFYHEKKKITEITLIISHRDGKKKYNYLHNHQKKTILPIEALTFR